MNTEKLEKFIFDLLQIGIFSGLTTTKIENYMQNIKDNIEQAKRYAVKRPQWVGLCEERISKNYNEMCAFIRSKKENIGDIPEIETNDQPEPEPKGISIPFNYITETLCLTNEQAQIGYHTGDCSNDVEMLSEQPEIKEQLLKIDPEQLKKELYDYGAWDDNELSNHEENLQRLLWMACGDIVDGKY